MTPEIQGVGARHPDVLGVQPHRCGSFCSACRRRLPLCPLFLAPPPCEAVSVRHPWASPSVATHGQCGCAQEQRPTAGPGMERSWCALFPLPAKSQCGWMGATHHPVEKRSGRALGRTGPGCQTCSSPILSLTSWGSTPANAEGPS